MSGRDSSEGRSLWDAVDGMVASKRVKIDRQGAPDAPADEVWLRGVACSVPLYVHAQATHKSASVVWATVPSLWDQATIALYGAEAGTGRGSKPLRERSVADLNLMEIRQQIIEGVRSEQEQRGETASTADFTAAEVRHVASLVQTKTPDQADGFAFRLTSWTRALETYLHAGEHEARDVHLRNSACPTCQARQVSHKQPDGEKTITPALLIQFRDGLVQAAVCQACGDTWWRGVEMETLADLLGVGLGERLGA